MLGMQYVRHTCLCALKKVSGHCWDKSGGTTCLCVPYTRSLEGLGGLVIWGSTRVTWAWAGWSGLNPIFRQLNGGIVVYPGGF